MEAQSSPSGMPEPQKGSNALPAGWSERWALAASRPTPGSEASRWVAHMDAMALCGAPVSLDDEGRNPTHAVVGRPYPRGERDFSVLGWAHITMFINGGQAFGLYRYGRNAANWGVIDRAQLWPIPGAPRPRS